MATFATEIISEILSKLPVKSLLRCKTVCKFWNSLIKSPNFVKLHLNQTLISNSDRYLLKTSGNTPFYYAKLDTSPQNSLSFSTLHHPLEDKIVDLLGSCNGVVCISNDKIDVFLYNPLTKSRRKLPPTRTIPNPEADSVMFGFGYDSKNDDYKVLMILPGFGFCYNEAQVYSINNNSWKSVELVSRPYFFPYAEFHGVHVNGVLHYVVSSQELESKQRKMIAGFDLATEKFSIIDCPINDDKSKMKWDLLEFYVMELGGLLAVMMTYLDGVAPNGRLLRADLWVMKEYGKEESWVKSFSMNKVECVDCLCNFIRPIVYSKNGRRVLVDIDCLELGWFDLESKTFEKVEACGVPRTYYDTGYFVGSLISVEYKQQHSVGNAKGKDNKKNSKKKDSDNFLSTGFKLKL